MISEQHLRDKLKSLRLTTGLSEAQVADKLGRSGNSYINRIENGPTKINIEMLEELCRLYNVDPIELFKSPTSQGASPREKRGFFEKTVFRGDDGIDENTKEQIKELLPTLRKIGKVQKLLGREPIKLQDISAEAPNINLTSTFSAQASARSAAKAIRTFFKIDENASIDISTFAWNFLNIPVCGVDLGSQCWGMYSSDREGNPLVIYSSSNKFRQRNVFTIAHEIGHYLFDHDHLTVDCENNDENLVEKVADTFAQELLVPAQALRQVYDELGLSLVDELKPHHIVSLSDHFKVSFYMMLVCLRQTQKINYEKYMELKEFCFNRLAIEAESLKYYPEKYFSDSKSLHDQLKDLVLIALRKKLIGFFEASKLVDEPESSLRSAI